MITPLKYEEAKRTSERDEKIDALYRKVATECTDAGKKLLFQYADEVAYRESDDVDFYYKTGVLDGIKLVFNLLEIVKN